MKSGHHSSGAIYVTFCNNPQPKHFLREKTILVCVISGPNEPFLEELNSVITPFVKDVLLLEQGMYAH